MHASAASDSFDLLLFCLGEASSDQMKVRAIIATTFPEPSVVS